MHIKTGWAPRDYLDLYVTDDGETFDLVQGGQAGNNDALLSNRFCKIARPSRTHTTKYSVRRYGFTPFSAAIDLLRRQFTID